MAIRTKKLLGQHFLRCGWVVDAMIAAADLSDTDTVLEIGPGTGILTEALAKRAGCVIAVEKDDALAESLRRKNIPRVEVVHGDILKLFQTCSTPDNYKVVANIPYYITSRLLRMLLESEGRPERIVLTIQKEVAERIVVQPPQMNLLAISVQAYGAPRIIKTVPASCFAPPPAVESAIIAVTDTSDAFFKKNNMDSALFFKIARAAFGQKRKQIINPLAAITGEKQKAAVALRAAGLNPRIRPQELTLDQWVALVRYLETV